MAAAQVLLEETLAQRAGALVRVLLGDLHLCQHRRRTDCPSQADAGEERLRGRSRLHDDVGSQRPQGARALGREGELTVGDVLDDEHAVSATDRDECLTTLGRQGHPGGVLVVGDGVQELRPARGAEPLEGVDIDALAVHGNPLDVGFEPAKAIDGTEVRRRLDGDHVAAINERLAEQAESVDVAAGDHELIGRRASPFCLLEAIAPDGPQAGQTWGGGVLQRHPRVIAEQRAAELLEDADREGLGIGQTAGEADQVSPGGEGQDGGELAAGALHAAGEGRGDAGCGCGGHRQGSWLEVLDSQRYERQTFAPEGRHMTGDGGRVPSDWQVYATGRLTYA